MTSLKEFYDTLRAMSFPEHPDSDALDDWILELGEADAYIAGLAQSVLGGQNPKDVKVADIGNLSKDLESIVVESDKDRDTYRQCKVYIQLLLQVREVLIKQGCQG